MCLSCSLDSTVRRSINASENHHWFASTTLLVFSEVCLLGDQVSFGKAVGILMVVAAICYGIHRIIQSKPSEKYATKIAQQA